MTLFKGTVERGSQRAEKLGFPTINILLSDPGTTGVFAARVLLNGKEYQAAVFADPARQVLEAHLLDFTGETYGDEARIELVEKLRETGSFDDDALLRVAIVEDVRWVREYFATHP